MFENISSKNEQKQNQKQDGIDRREFLKTLGKAGVATAATVWGWSKLEDLVEEENESLRYDGEKLTHGRKDVPAGELAGRKEKHVNSLYKLLLGLSVNLDDVHEDVMKIPDVIEDVDFTEQLGALWSTKRQLNPKELTPVAQETGEKLISEYAELTPNGVSIDEYSDEIDRVAKDTHSRLNWGGVQNQFTISDEKTNLVKAIAGQLGGKELLSYALTELMPSNDGDLNRDVFDYMLKNAGREYVERVPAIYDGLTSFGPYQFTANALFRTPEEVRGASHLADHVGGEKVPGSVSKLRGINHHQAAYLLAAKHIIQLVRRLEGKNLDTLKNNWQHNMSDITQFIAAAHNYPYTTEHSIGGLRSGEYWVANDMKEDFSVSAGSQTREYAEKTARNYEALS